MRWWKWIAAASALVIYSVFFVDREAESAAQEKWRDQRALELAQNSMAKTERCLAGEDVENYTKEDDCQVSWSFRDRVGFYRDLVKDEVTLYNLPD